MRHLSLIGVIAVLSAVALLTITDADGSAAAPAAAPFQALSTPAPPVPSGGTPNTSPHPPSAPTNLVVTDVKPGSVTLSWTASRPGCCAIEGYTVTYNRRFDDIFRLQQFGNVTTVTITSYITATAEYSFRVMARDTLGKTSPSSNEVKVVVPAVSTGDTTPPSTPGNLAAGEPTAAGVPLSWTPATDNVGVVGYDVFFFDGWFVSIPLATVTGTSYVAAPMSSPVRTQYYVRARDAAGNLGAATAPISVTVPTPGTSSPPPPTLSCRVGYSVTAQWDGGFVSGVTVTNTGSTLIDGWTLTFTFGGDQLISNAWGASHTQAGTAVTLRNAGWNGRLAAGASATAGFQGTWGSSAAVPTGYAVNGVPCTT